MFVLFKKIKINKHTDRAREYLNKYFTPSISKEDPFELPRSGSVSGNVRYSLKNENLPQVPHSSTESPDGDGVRYSLKRKDPPHVQYSRRYPPASDGDNYNFSTVSQVMQNYDPKADLFKLLKKLDQATDRTFVDTLMTHIRRKDLRDSDVYKAAQIDRRLFSKIMSDRKYKPSKDTAIAIAFALRLSFQEAIDLLSRAGYTLSHSNKKDVLIEYFFRERIYKLDDINMVLYNFGEKIIGR